MSYISHLEASGIKDLFRELQQRVAHEGVTKYDEFVELIDELIDEKVGAGALSDEDDIIQIKADLEFMWNEIKK